jgi:hypothetical protein
MSRNFTARIAILLLGAASALASGRHDVVLDRSAVPLPRNAPAALRPLVQRESLRVAAPERISATFWLRTSLPERKTAAESSPVLGERIAIPGILPATFVGFVSFDRPWRDYRDRVVPLGLYTARYLLQPAIKEHKGVSEYRDFLILTPANADTAIDVEPRELIGRSAAGSGSGHPFVIALFPLPDPGEAPRILVNPLGQPMLGVRLGPHAFAIVLEGHGRIEEI